MEEANLETDTTVRRQWLTFVIAGGGFAGAETAGAVNDFVRETAKFYPRLSDEEIRVVVIHPGDYLLPELGEELGRYAERKMRERKVEVSRVRGRVADSDGWVVALNNGLSIPSATLIWTAGVKPNTRWSRLWPARKREDGLLRISIFRSWIYRAMDRGRLRGGAGWSQTDIFFHPRRSTGMREAIVAAKNIERTISAQPLQAFRYRTMGMLASIGHHTGVASFFWDFEFLRFHRLVDVAEKHLAKLPRLRGRSCGSGGHDRVDP